jgi:hypothetical protein
VAAQQHEQPLGLPVSVLLTNASLGLRRRVDGARDAHGSPLPTGWGALVGPADGLLNEQPDATWVVGLDPTLWPVRQNDMVIDAVTGAAFLVDTAKLAQHPVDDTVNWIRCTARQRGNGGTEPGGPWFVNRYAPDVGPTTYRGEASVFTGEGPPPADPDTIGAVPGDEYLDLTTGVIYGLA